MADTVSGYWPNEICDDCGTKGVTYRHWGPLVPSSAVAKLCDQCMNDRAKAETVKPLGYKKS